MKAIKTLPEQGLLGTQNINVAVGKPHRPKPVLELPRHRDVAPCRSHGWFPCACNVPPVTAKISNETKQEHFTMPFEFFAPQAAAIRQRFPLSGLTVGGS